MKLRIRGNSIRLRLKQSEVDRISKGEVVADETAFPGGSFHYRLFADERGAITADFDGGAMSIGLPHTMARPWAAGDQVSLLGEQASPGVAPLTILVEKDFACLTPGDNRADEDDEDTYPHPDAGTGRGC